MSVVSLITCKIMTTNTSVISYILSIFDIIEKVVHLKRVTDEVSNSLTENGHL